MYAESRTPAPLAAHQAAIAAGARELVSDLSVEFSRGDFIAVLGRNGCGKTLTLHTLAGLREPRRGRILLDGMPFAERRNTRGRRSIAQHLGLLAQDPEEGFVATVLETVLIGRHPYLRFWQWESGADIQRSQRALHAVGLDDLGARRTDVISGGEQRRVAIAALLAQDPAVFLLDEPTNHLDPHHQLAVLNLFRELAHSGRTVVATLHDPTLAARFADRVLLLFGDGRWKEGPVAQMMTAGNLSELYLTPVIELRQGERRIFVAS